MIFTYGVFTGQIKMSFYLWYSSTLCAKESKTEKSSLGTLMVSGRSPSILICICSIYAGSGVFFFFNGLWGWGCWPRNIRQYLLDAQLFLSIQTILGHQAQLWGNPLPLPFPVGMSHQKSIISRLLGGKAAHPWVILV